MMDKSDKLKTNKKGRSEDDVSFKTVKTIKGDNANAVLLSAGAIVDAQLRSGGFVIEDQRNMLSFSSAAGVGDVETDRNTAFQLCYPQPADFGNLSSPNMHVPFAGARQLFTRSQWFELEQQALIYKYIAANVSVPANLIIPIRNSFSPWAYPASISMNGSLSSSSLGWGAFHLGIAGSTDPEPGRCRRTDGKKWRCTKDAAHGHKYCDKHLNRGRHRSRKLVEGQKPDQHVTGVTSFPKVVSMCSSSPKFPIGHGGGGAPLHLSKGALSTLNPSAEFLTKRTQDLHGISVPPMGSKNAVFAIPKPRDPFEESNQSFGFVSSDYLQNPYQKIPPVLSSQGSQNQHPLRQFMEDWPREQSDHSNISWQEEVKPDWTKLSMSIPIVSSGFSSSASSPTHKKLSFSPLRLGHEVYQNEMGSGSINESYLKEPTYSLTNSSWVSSTGGPLGEVLKISSNKNESPSGLNLVTKGWVDCAKSTQYEPSPTGVLLESTFCSLSNSSSGSSPRAKT